MLAAATPCSLGCQISGRNAYGIPVSAAYKNVTSTMVAQWSMSNRLQGYSPLDCNDASQGSQLASSWQAESSSPRNERSNAWIKPGKLALHCLTESDNIIVHRFMFV
jgi:hypothetical protein